jgi:membrane-associated phospholipid phosphatase
VVQGGGLAELLTTDTRWWAVDRLILSYFAVACTVTAFYFTRVPEAAWLLAVHAAAVALLVWAVKRPARWTWHFRHWYALPYVAACYKESAILIPVVRGSNSDQWLADLDFRFWGAHPTVWLERMYSPLLTEYLQIVYSLFVPAVLLIPWLIWKRGRYAEFRAFAFLVAIGFLVSYIGYFCVPARGPRFLLKELQQTPLHGLWLFEPLQRLLDNLESAHYDCFPSGHTELTIIAWWGSRLISKYLFAAYFVYTLCIIFATVYLRYHYTIDVLAGVMTAALLIAGSPMLYRKLSPTGGDLGGR